MNSLLKKFTFSEELTDVIENCKGVSVPTSKAELYDMVFGPEHADVYDVVFDVPGKGLFKEADVVRCKNGASVNFTEDYMRRREPDCMRIADDKPTDKKRNVSCMKISSLLGHILTYSQIRPPSPADRTDTRDTTAPFEKHFSSALIYRNGQ